MPYQYPDELYPHERQRQIARSYPESAHYLYASMIGLNCSTTTELDVEELPSFTFNTDVGSGMSAEEVVNHWYERDGGNFIISGVTGSGKTTLLLEMTRHLLQLAVMDDKAPIAAVVNVGSWIHEERGEIYEWLKRLLPIIDSALNWWLRKGKLVLMVDGLDELPLPHREACLQKFKKFSKKYPHTPLIFAITPDTVDLSSLVSDQPLSLQPLTVEQVDDYLDQLGDGVAGLRSAITNHETSQKLATLPLNLTLMILTFHHQLSSEIEGNLPMTTDDVIDAFVSRRLASPVVASNLYSPEEIQRYLGWLGYQYKRLNRGSVDLWQEIDHLWVSNPELFPKLFPRLNRWLFSSILLLMGLPNLIFEQDLIGIVVVIIFAAPLLMGIAAREEYQLSMLNFGAGANAQKPSATKIYLAYMLRTGLVVSAFNFFYFYFYNGSTDILGAIYIGGCAVAFFFLLGTSLFTDIEDYIVFQWDDRPQKVLIEEGSIPEDFERFLTFAKDELGLLTQLDRDIAFVHPRFRDYFATHYESISLNAKQGTEYVI